MTAPQPGAGFYGKLPSRGDFVSRNLPSSLVLAWDRWLSASVAESRREIGAAWLERYLLAPPWRFALSPGVAGPTGWMGVMLTSVDAVGRAFPLVLAAGLPAGTGLGRLSGDPSAALERLERLGLSMIHAGRDPEGAVEEVARLGEAAVAAATAPVARRPVGPGWATDGRPEASIAVRMTMTVRTASFEERSLWWHEGWAGGTPRTMVFDGLPDPSLFVAFLAAAPADRPAGPA